MAEALSYVPGRWLTSLRMAPGHTVRPGELNKAIDQLIDLLVENRTAIMASDAYSYPAMKERTLTNMRMERILADCKQGQFGDLPEFKEKLADWGTWLESLACNEPTMMAETKSHLVHRVSAAAHMVAYTGLYEKHAPAELSRSTLSR